MFTTQFHVKEQGAAKPIHGRRRRQDESVSKKVLDIDRRFIDAFSALNGNTKRRGAQRYAESRREDSQIRTPPLNDRLAFPPPRR